MKLEKAIEILKHTGNTPSGYSCADVGDAIQLGIEALKEVERIRKVEICDPTIMLPGETTK